MENDHNERGMFEFPNLETPAIVAMKGFPCTYKSWIASTVAKWARCPIIRIDDILDKLYSEEAGDNGDSSPSVGEGERLHRRGFDILCDVAASQLRFRFTDVDCVVIKSRLCSTFELDRLIELAGLASDDNHIPHPLLIIECQARNEYMWIDHYDSHLHDYDKSNWYTAKNWDEVEMARSNYDAQAWDRYFLQSFMKIPQERQHLVRRLVLNSSSTYETSDLEVNPLAAFADAIIHLLTGDGDELHKLAPVVEYNELRRSRLEQALLAPCERSKYICTTGGCFFEYCQALEDFEGAASCCGVCEEQVSGHAGYACHFCSLALHQSCAELDSKHSKPYLDGFRSYSVSKRYDFPGTHACNSCREREKAFSYNCSACILQTHLKCRMMPTIIYHPCHGHFLSIRLASSVDEDDSYVCKACGRLGKLNSYVCKFCNYRFHISCISLPREVKHEHGGYEHLMKLMYYLMAWRSRKTFGVMSATRTWIPMLGFILAKSALIMLFMWTSLQMALAVSRRLIPERFGEIMPLVTMLLFFLDYI